VINKKLSYRKQDALDDGMTFIVTQGKKALFDTEQYAILLVIHCNYFHYLNTFFKTSPFLGERYFVTFGLWHVTARMCHPSVVSLLSVCDVDTRYTLVL